MNRRLVLLAIVALLVIGSVIPFWMFVLHPIRVHRPLERTIRNDIVGLLSRRPTSVPKGQWEFMVGWTLNLHGNCASDPLNVKLDKMAAFSDELRRRTDAEFAVDIIDWIWNEYGAFTTNGVQYSDKYRPTRSPELLQAQEGCFGLTVIDQGKGGNRGK